MANEPLTDGFLTRTRRVRAATIVDLVRRGPFGSARDPKRGNPIAPSYRTPRHQPAEQVERRWQRGTCEARRAAVAIDHVDGQAILDPHVIHRADALEKLERVAVTAEQDVLTVVDALTRRGIGKCRRAPSKRRPRFENKDARSFFREHRRRRESREAAADDDRVVLAPSERRESRGQRANIACAHKRIAITARYGRGTRILRLKTS